MRQDPQIEEKNKIHWISLLEYSLIEIEENKIYRNTRTGQTGILSEIFIENGDVLYEL